MEPEREVVECMGTWEARAAELFTVCDRECKGFITKRDLQHLWGELPLDPDELESVFDSLDRDQNGFLSLQEFTNGFGSHLGLVIEFRADSSSSGSEGEQFIEAGEVSGGEGGGTEDCQLDTILALLASQDLDSNSAVVEAVWQQISGSGASMERLVAALLQELSRVKLEHGHLEAALATKTEQFNQQVSRLYEELEAQISGEQVKAAQEQRQRGARVLATLEEEVAERDAALRALEEEQQGLRQRLEQAAAGEVAARQDNLRLEQHLKRLEEDLMRREAEVEELMQALDIHRRNTKNEKRRRAQQAFKVTEGIARERESLVTQLDLLRTINTQLRDEQDQIMPWSFRARERVDLVGGGEEDNSSQSPPPPDLRGVACTSPPPRPLASLPLFTTTSSFHSVGTASDYEHDDDYFSDTKVEVQQDSPSPSSPGEVSILQEILSQPALCVECGGALPSRPVENSAVGTSTARPLLLRRQESFTQTSPTAETSPRSIETLVNTPDDAGDKEAKQTKFVGECCNPELPKPCICDGRIKTTTSSPPQWYSSSLVIFQPHLATTPAKPFHTTTPVKPLHTTTHLHMVHHTLHTHHTHHTFHTSFTYFHPDISATATRHTKSTQSVEHYTLPQRHTPPQQTTEEHDTKHQQHTAPRKPLRSNNHTSPCHPTIPEEPVASHHITQHHRTSHESSQQSQEAELHYSEALKHRNTKDHSDTQGKHNNTQGQHDDSKKHSDTREKHSDSKKYSSTQEKHKNIQEKYCNTQKKHSDVQEKYSSAQEKHSSAQEKHSDGKKHSSTQQKHSDMQEKHSNTQEKHSNTQEKHSNTQEKHSNTQEKHSNTQEKHSTTQEKHGDTQEKHNDSNQHNDTQKRQSETQEKHDITQEHHSTQQHITEQHSGAEKCYSDALEQHRAQQSITENQRNDVKQYMETQKQHTKKHSNINQYSNTQKQGKSSPKQQNQTNQHTDTQQEDNNNTQCKTQEQSNVPLQQKSNTEQQIDQYSTKQHNTDTQEPVRRGSTNNTEQTVTNSHPQHISNTLQAPLTTNQSIPTIENTRKKISDTGSEVTEGVAEEDTVKDKTLSSIPEDSEPEVATSSSSSRQGNALNPNVTVTSLLDIRRSTTRRNTPTGVVTPLRHHFPLDATAEEQPRTREEVHEDTEESEACATRSPAVDDLYCPTRMFKVVFIGDSGVGKTTFIHRASTGEYRRDFGSTVGVDYRTVEVRVPGVVAVLQLWDTAGQERFRSITRQYYRNADCVVVMYDLTSEHTFLNVVDWISSIREAGSEGVMVAVVGNKEDLEDQRRVDLNEANRLAKSHNCYVCECSAARGSSVQEVLNDLTSLLMSGNSLQGPRSPVILLNQAPRPSRACCRS
ncbi:protein split ends-like isoform X2 [Scylla paramamosain]|uniref:protein split ends-like isoform X2 n=1 Tax=Scylla paramamosain TaxID=85552 RepID=UPI003082C233